MEASQLTTASHGLVMTAVLLTLLFSESLHFYYLSLNSSGWGGDMYVCHVYGCGVIYVCRCLYLCMGICLCVCIHDLM